MGFVSSSWFSRLGAVVQKMEREPSTDQPIHLHWLAGWLASFTMLSLLISAKVIEVVLQPLEASHRSSGTCQGSSRCKNTSVHDDFIASIIEAISCKPNQPTS
ncbi:hypothetical protein NW765_003761 [Fusarium oxysporum]|nr:hypothetical protein NW765_003761 [Fusarium oxysporum]KAJ4283247.1 hypothetical protein NW764_002649 [Fusarium oxysporum]